ncbi:ribosome maturation factor RimM [Neomicrococcus aestuarii]|uniref:Ribosome maturation factor RimM n=1 Tax=Neomicrococcus aestuarii TaxID=556325 RepID=A0A1L2ZL75_9MICC|nr:ribosome maturation factor RimM [Neomicrococcus aestuarii]APF39959.1 ribosome maturation factor RimM [Neomicrococcus aestuarii]
MRVRVARLGKPHGIRGEVTVEVMTDDPGSRFAPGTVLEAENSAHPHLTVEGARWNKEILVVAFEEIVSRNDAEAARGTFLYFDTEEVEEDDSEGYYEHELEGLEVRIGDAVVGKVTGLRTGTAQDLLVVEDNEGEEVFVPFVEQIVPEVDLEGGFVRLRPPDGLFTVNKADSVPDDGLEEQ